MALGLACVVAGCGGGTMPQVPSAIGDVVRGAGSVMTQTGQSTAQSARQGGNDARAPSATQAAAQAPVPAQDTRQRGAATAQPSGAPLASRPFAGLQALFAKGTVDGVELVTELTAMRDLMRSSRLASSAGALLGTQAASPARSRAPAIDPTAELQKMALRSVEDAIKPYVSSIGFGALDSHLATLVEDPKLLRDERIKLPTAQGLTQAQMQRVVNMAAILVATRATGKILKKALADFATVEDDYLRLIERREMAAQVLYGLLLKQSATAPGDLAGLYSADDAKYLREVAKMPPSEFATDLGAQNLALRVLRKSDPAAWTDYKGRSDGLRAATQGYIRSAAGVTAFAALLANFGNETLGQVSRMQGSEIAAVFPYAVEFGKEVPPLLKAAWEVGAAGVVEIPSRASKRFKIVSSSGTQDARSASDVFEAMKRLQTEALFKESLFRTGADGLVYKVFRCDRAEAGRMLDVAVPVADRDRFATIYLPEAGPRFSFQNAFTNQASRQRDRELGDDLLRSDHRERTSVVAFGELQRRATEGALRWNNDQFMRLILANREGAAAHATLQLGDASIRLVPSMQAVYAYESLSDACAEQFGGARASR